MKEVYRSFEGKLDVDNQSGYIISELKDFYQVDFLSVWQGRDSKVRIKKELLPECDFSDIDKITKLTDDIEYGRQDAGQCYYNGKWYGYDTICDIQNKNQTSNWKRYAK